jgi:NAD(P)-dependent dehydrogenase (short-subunit alcohol dehydrogenase family)
MKKIAFITGANKGLGYETALRLGKMDIIVILAGRNIEAVELAAAKIRQEGIQAYAVQLDITNQQHISQAAEFVQNTFGHLDILINNAGILLDRTQQVDADLFRTTFETNVIGVYALTQELLPLLRKSRQPRIVNLSSILGSIHNTAQPSMAGSSWLTPAYSSSKAALNMLTVYFAQILANTNAKVNSAHPGWVRTDMGGKEASLSIEEGVETTLRLALLGPDGPTGSFFHKDKVLPW